MSLEGTCAGKHCSMARPKTLENWYALHRPDMPKTGVAAESAAPDINVVHTCKIAG